MMIPFRREKMSGVAFATPDSV